VGILRTLHSSKVWAKSESTLHGDLERKLTALRHCSMIHGAAQGSMEHDSLRQNFAKASNRQAAFCLLRQNTNKNDAGVAGILGAVTLANIGASGASAKGASASAPGAYAGLPQFSGWRYENSSSRTRQLFLRVGRLAGGDHLREDAGFIQRR
jgi:hypothetical protein